MAQTRLPGGLLGGVVEGSFVDNFDSVTHKKDPEFYPEDFVELVNAFKALREGKQLTLSKAAQGRLFGAVRDASEDSDIPAIREQARKWLKEHAKR
jgi:hypothetical protein